MGEWKKSTETYHFHGVDVEDPFRWLENEGDKDTIAWSKEQKQHAAKYFSEDTTENQDR